MRFYLRFEKGLIAGALLGGLGVAVLVAGGTYAPAVIKSGSTLAVLEMAAVVVLSALVGGLFFALCGRWSVTPARGVVFGLLLGGLLLLLRAQVTALLSLLLRVPVTVDLTSLLASVPSVAARLPETENLSGARAEEIARITACMVCGVLQGLLFGWLWRRDVRRCGRVHRTDQSTTAS